MRKILLLTFAVICSATASAQWGADRDYGVEAVPAGTNMYDKSFVVTPDGTTWFYYYHPAVDEQSNNASEITLQAIDKDGKKLFGDKGMVVCNYLNLTWTEFNQYLYANSDNTVTLCVRDLRNSNDEDRFETYTAYRISRDGEQLWGDDGVNLDEYMQQEDARCMHYCELSDGCTAFAWQRTYGDVTCLEIQKVDKGGECQYSLDNTRLYKKSGYYSYPFIVPSDNGSFILVYGYGSDQYLRAMKYNPDGTQAWASEYRIYSGGWGSVPALQSRVRVYPGPDDGVIVTWNDDRNSDGWYSAYLAYILKDGTSKFTNASGKCDIKLSYEEWSAYPPRIVVTDSAFYAVFSQFSDAQQNWQQLTIQKVDAESGELLWGDNGVQVKPIAEDQQLCGSEDIQLGKDNELVCFYQLFTDYHNIKNYMSIRNAGDGEAVGTAKEEICWRASEHYRDYKSSAVSKVDNTWIVNWVDDPVSVLDDSETLHHCFTKFTFNGIEVGTVEKGDINEDNVVDVADISSVLTEMYAPGSFKDADVNGDGKVDVADITSVLTIMYNNK